MDSLLPTQRQDCTSFIKAFDYCLYALGARVRLGPLRFLHRDQKWLDSIRVVHDQVDIYIDRAMKNARESKDDPEVADQTPERYVLVNEMAKQTHDRLDLRSQILAVFMPGRDSTAHALSNVFHVLARRPDVYSKLREEVLQYKDTELSFELLKSMKYLQWILNEGTKSDPSTSQLQET